MMMARSENGSSCSYHDIVVALLLEKIGASPIIITIWCGGIVWLLLSFGLQKIAWKSA
jgi:hypothetical protein